MANIELTGVLIEKNETVQKTETFKIREFAIEVAGEKFSDYYKIQLLNDNCAKVDSAKVGDTIELKLNVRGRKWGKDGKTSYFTTLEAWFIKVVSSAPTATAPIYTPPAEQVGKDGLPF